MRGGPLARLSAARLVLRVKESVVADAGRGAGPAPKRRERLAGLDGRDARAGCLLGDVFHFCLGGLECRPHPLRQAVLGRVLGQGLILPEND